MAASEYTVFHLKNTIYSCTVRSNVFSIVYTYSFTFLLIYFTCKLAKRQTLCLSYNLYWLFLSVSSYDVFIRNYWGTSRLKVTFKNYKKNLYTRSGLVCFDDIFDQIESSISNNIVQNFFRQPLHDLSSIAFIISTFVYLTHCTLTNTHVVHVLKVIFWWFLSFIFMLFNLVREYVNLAVM